MKFVLKALGFLFLLLLLAMVILLFIPDRQYKNLAENVIRKTTNRQIMIGELTTQRNLTPSIQLKQLRLANPDWAGKSEMITVEEFNASIDLIGLIKGKFNIDLASQALNIDLIRNKEGKSNWAFTEEDTGTTKQQSENPSIQTLARFVLKHLSMKDFRLNFDDQQAGSQHKLVIDEMDVVETEDGIVQKFDVKGSLDDLPLSLTGNTGTFLELKRNNKLPLDLKASLDDLALSIKGSIDAESDGPNLNTTLDLSMPTLSVASKFANQSLPDDWKDVKGTSNLLSKAGQFSLQNIDLTMKGGLEVAVKGDITDLNKFQGADLDLDANLASIKSLSSFTAEPLPELGPVKFSGKVVTDQDKLVLKASNLSYDGEYGAAQISGDVGNLIDIDQVDLKAKVDLPNLNIAKLFTNADIPALGNIKVTGDIVSNGARDLSANNLKLAYDHQGLTVSTSGSVKSIIKNGGDLDLGVNAAVNSLASLNELAKTELPDLGPIDASTKVTGTFSEIRVNQIVAEFNDAVLMGSIKGDVGSISKFDQIKVNADLKSPSIGDLLSKLSVQSTAKTPAQLSASLNKQGEGIKLDKFDLQMDDNQINGQIELQGILAESQRPRFIGNIDITKLDLNDVLGQPAEATDTSTTKKSGTVIPDTPLPFDLIRKNDLDLALDIKDFDSSFITLKDTDIKLVADQGKLTLGPFNSNLNGGDTFFKANIDASATPANLSLETKIDGFSFKQAGTFKDSTLLENEGTANAGFTINGSGESVAAILGTANGNGFVDIKNLTIKNDLISFVSGDLVKEATAKLNPLEQQHDTTKILCAAIKTDISDGLMKAPNGYIADAEAFTITGKAQVNFKDQGLDIEVNTNPKEGLGLGLGELARVVKIAGTIAEPKIGISAEGVAEIGATVGAAIATGGVSLLAQGQLEKIKAHSESCAEILK